MTPVQRPSCRQIGARRRSIRGWIAAVAWLWVALGTGGCRTAGRKPGGTKTLALKDVEGYLEFVIRDRTRDQQSKVGAGDSSSTETILEQNLQIGVDGYLYHPNLMEFSLAGLFGLLQQENMDDFGGRIRTTKDSGDVLEFDLNAQFLKKKRFPGTVFARRHRTIVPRPFQSSLQTTTTSLGFVWQYIDPKMPTTLQFSKIDVDLDSFDPRDADGRQQNTQLQFETGYKFSDSNELTFRFNSQDISEEPFTLNYDTDELTLSHRWDFGAERQHRLESELNYSDQKGTFNIRRKRWRETLRLKHTETLRSWYRFEALERIQGNLFGVPPIQERSYYLAGTVEHKLYESLISRLFAFTQLQQFAPNLDINRFGIQANFDYRKKNRWGRLTAGYMARLQVEDRTGGDRSIEVIDETATFREPEPITLTVTNIDIPTIRITDEARTTMYERGRDYRLQVLPDRVDIERIVTGRIADGQTVLIDYVFIIGGDYKLDSVSQRFTIRQDFTNGISPYFRLRLQNQTVTPESPNGVTPENIRANVVGIEYRRKALTMSAEYEDYKSNIAPFRAIRLSADYTRRFKWGAKGVAKARWAEIIQGAPIPRTTQLWTLEGRYRHPISKTLTFEGSALYRRELDTINGPDKGLNFDLSLEWIVRQTEVRVTWDSGKFEDNFSRNDFSRLFVQVKRSF